jgi:hypothetical protein
MGEFSEVTILVKEKTVWSIKRIWERVFAPISLLSYQPVEN